MFDRLIGSIFYIYICVFLCGGNNKISIIIMIVIKDLVNNSILSLYLGSGCC